MLHRHLEVDDGQRYTLAAIDDIIARGLWDDWAELRGAALGERGVLDKIERVCRHYVGDPRAQRHHFWLHYVRKHRSDA